MSESSRPHIGHNKHDKSKKKQHDSRPHNRKTEPSHPVTEPSTRPSGPSGPSQPTTEPNVKQHQPTPPSQLPTSGTINPPRQPQTDVINYQLKINSYQVSIYLERDALVREQEKYLGLKRDVLQARHTLYNLGAEELKLYNFGESLMDSPNERINVGYPKESLVADLVGFVVENTSRNHHEGYLERLKIKLDSIRETVSQAREGNAVLQNEQTDLLSKINKKKQSIRELKEENNRVESFNAHRALIHSVSTEASLCSALEALPVLSSPAPRFKESPQQGLPHHHNGDSLLSYAIENDNPELFSLALSKHYPYNVPSLTAKNPLLMIAERLPGALNFLDKIPNLKKTDVELILSRITLSSWPFDEGLKLGIRLLTHESEHLDKNAQNKLIEFMAQEQQYTNAKVMTLATPFFSKFEGVYQLSVEARQSFLKHIVEGDAKCNRAALLIKLYKNPSLSPATLLSDLSHVLDKNTADAIFNECMEDPTISSIKKFREVSDELIDKAFYLAEHKNNNTLLATLLSAHLDRLTPHLYECLQFYHNRVRLVHNLKQDFYSFNDYKNFFVNRAELSIRKATDDSRTLLSVQGLNGFNINDKILLAYFSANVDSLLKEDGLAAIDGITHFVNSGECYNHAMSKRAVVVLIKHIKNQILSTLNNYNVANMQSEGRYDEQACAKLMSSHRIQKKICGVSMPGTLFFTPSTLAYQKIRWGYEVSGSIESQENREEQEFSSLGLK